MHRFSKKIFWFIIIISAIIYMVIHISTLVPGTSPFISVVVVLFLVALIYVQWQAITQKKR